MTLPNFSEYVVPGVYWANTSAPVASLALSTDSVVALVGPGIGYRTFSEPVALTGTTPTELTQLGIDATDPSFVVTSLDGSTIYSSSTDYTVTSVASTDGFSADTTTTLVRQSGSTIPSSTGGAPVVSVSYEYTDNNYLAPSRAVSLAQVQALYGPALDPNTGAILSPLSFAAQFAINAGASQLVLVATPNATVAQADLTNAYALLTPFIDVNIVVPLPVGLTGTVVAPGSVVSVASDLANWCQNWETDSDLLRVGILGYETSVSVGPDTIAKGAAYKRVIEAWPNKMTWFNGITNSTATVAGYYLAAAYAGILAGNLPQQGLTRRSITGFSGIDPSVFQIMTKAYKDQLSGAGVAVAELSRSGVLWCRHGTSTDPTSVFTREVSLTRSQDAMVELLEGAVEQAGIIGTPIGPDTLVNLQALAIGVLNTCQTQGIIEAYGSVTTQESSTDPTIVTITFSYQPSYPLNYVDFSFSVNTTTGSVTSGTSTGTAS